MVGGEDEAEAGDAEEDAEELGVVVADVEEEEGEDDDDGDGPEVDELGGEDGGLFGGGEGLLVMPGWWEKGQ